MFFYPQWEKELQVCLLIEMIEESEILMMKEEGTELLDSIFKYTREKGLIEGR